MFVFYQYNSAPLFFNAQVEKQMVVSENGAQYQQLQTDYRLLESERQEFITTMDWSDSSEADENKLKAFNTDLDNLRSESKKLISSTLPDAEDNDKDYVFLHFILNNLPIGLIGLLLAVFFCACLLYTSPSPRDATLSRMPSSA